MRPLTIASAVTRLLDLGIEPYLVSSSLLAVLSQRLVRKVCSKYGVEQVLTDEKRVLLGMDENRRHAQYRIGPGCPACRSTQAIVGESRFALVRVDESIRRRI